MRAGVAPRACLPGEGSWPPRTGATAVADRFLLLFCARPFVRLAFLAVGGGVGGTTGGAAKVRWGGAGEGWCRGHAARVYIPAAGGPPRALDQRLTKHRRRAWVAATPAARHYPSRRLLRPHSSTSFPHPRSAISLPPSPANAFAVGGSPACGPAGGPCLPPQTTAVTPPRPSSRLYSVLPALPAVPPGTAHHVPPLPSATAPPLQDGSRSQ